MKGYMLLCKMTDLVSLGNNGVDGILSFQPRYDFWDPRIKTIAR